MPHSIRIRAAVEQDAAAMAAVYAPYVRDTAITFEYEAPNAGEFAERLRRIARFFPFLAAEDETGLLGYAYASPFHQRAAYAWAAETSVYVRMDSRRQGVGRRLYEALEEALRLQGIRNLNACIAFPPAENDPYLTRDSDVFHERMGFRLVGAFHRCGYKFGRWYDIIWMEKLIGRHDPNPPAVQPFSAVRDRLAGLSGQTESENSV